MTYTVKLLSDAERDLRLAYEWYEEKQRGLGNKFRSEVGACITRISKNPYLFQVRFNEVFRFALLKTFPYLVVYKINDEKGEVIINAIFHCSRDPALVE